MYNLFVILVCTSLHFSNASEKRFRDVESIIVPSFSLQTPLKLRKENCEDKKRNEDTEQKRLERILSIDKKRKRELFNLQLLEKDQLRSQIERQMLNEPKWAQKYYDPSFDKELSLRVSEKLNSKKCNN